MKIYRSFSSGETRKLASELARKYAKKRTRKNAKGAPHQSKHGTGQALVFALSGELGSGKTTFVQGFLRGLGIRKRSPSPTFIIFRRFALPRKEIKSFSRGRRHLPFANLYHVDAYRLKNPSELLTLGFREILADPKNLVLIEWADKIKKILPKNALRIRFRHGRKENERRLAFLEMPKMLPPRSPRA